MQIALSPKQEVIAIQAAAQRISEIAASFQDDCAECGGEPGYHTRHCSNNPMNADESAPDAEAFYDRRGRIVREDPNADYDLEAKYAEVD